MLCLGLASALRKAAAQRYPKEKLDRKKESLWLLGFGFIFGAIGIFFFWPDKIYILSELRNMSLWLLLPLAINVSATTAALLLGRSIIFPMDEDLYESALGNDNTDEYDGFTLLFLIGVVGGLSTMPPRRSYSNWIQHCCFDIAIMCASCKLLTSARKKRNIWRDDPSSYELLVGLAEAPMDTEEVVHPLDLRSSYMTERSHYIIEIQNPFNRARTLKMNGSTVFVALIMLMVWVTTISNNYLGPTFPGKAASIDRHYAPLVPLEIVINMYKEPLEDVKGLQMVSRVHPRCPKRLSRSTQKTRKQTWRRLKCQQAPTT
jgi:hypothetical protein